MRKADVFIIYKTEAITNLSDFDYLKPTWSLARRTADETFSFALVLLPFGFIL